LEDFLIKFGLILASVIVVAVPARAATVFYNLVAASSATAGGGTQIANANAYGNVRQYTTGGITMTATAFSIEGDITPANDTGTFSAARLFQWTTYGYGICAQLDAAGDCQLPTHSIDNEVTPTAGVAPGGTGVILNPGSFDPVGQYRYEFVLFRFSTDVTIDALTLDPYDNGNGDPNDRDVTYFTTTNSSLTPASFTGVTLLGLSSLGFGSAVNVDSAASFNPLTLTIGTAGVRAVLLGARIHSATSDMTPDYFKFNNLTVSTVPPVPEPGTFGMLGAALLALGFVRRRTVQ
jgi:hypothetical protein